MSRVLLPVALVMLVGAGCSKDQQEITATVKADAPASAETAEWQELGAADRVDERVQQLLADAKKRQQPVFIDFGADWCVPCKEMEKTVLPDPRVKGALGRFVKVKVDTTADTDAMRTVQQRYSVTSMPTFLFFGPGGALLDDLRVTQKVDAATLIARLEKVPSS